MASLERAGPAALGFLRSPSHLAQFRSSRAGAVLIDARLAPETGGPATRIIVEDLEEALQRAAVAFAPAAPAPLGIDPLARVAPDAHLEAQCYVGPFAVIESGGRVGARTQIEAGAWIGPNVVTGDDCRIGPHAVCCAGVRLGNRVVVKAGAVIGGAGFGYIRRGDELRRSPQIGGCRLEDDVEIGSATCIDRGSFDDTVVGQGTKIDNLVQIGHNVRLGKRCLVMATVGIAGSCEIGDDVIIAGGAGIRDHVVIGSGATITAKSVVMGSVRAGAAVSGYPARPHRDFLRAQAALYRLAPVVDALTDAADAARAATDHRTTR